MKHETEGKGITREIEEYRAEIKESQEKIAKLEKELNEIYEKAADAMNLLEENGVKVDMDGIKAEKDYDGIVEGYADYPCISHMHQNRLFFTRIREVKQPTKAHPTDAGIDFFVPDAKAWTDEYKSMIRSYSKNPNHQDLVFIGTSR